MEENRGKPVRGSGMGYRIFVLKRVKSGGYSVRRPGRLAKGMTTDQVMEVLRRLAPHKGMTAVAVTPTGSIHLSAQAGKRGGKTKTSAKVASIATAAPKGGLRKPYALWRGSSSDRPDGPMGGGGKYSVNIGPAGTVVFKAKTSQQGGKKTSR